MVPPTSCSAVEVFVKKVDEDIKSFVDDKVKIDHIPNNLNLSERAALSSLSVRQDIVIKPADKGGAIVIIDNEKYEAEVWRQLSDTTTYKLLGANSIFGYSPR